MKTLIIVHVSSEGPGLFEPMLQQAGMATEIIDVERGDALPSTLDGVGALIVMGGPMNAYQEKEHPFLAREDVLLRQALTAEVPVLGVCLGAQLLAKAAGARVYRSPVAEFAWGYVEITPEGRHDPLLEGVVSPMFVFQWHGDTFDVPANGTLIARGVDVPNQAIRVGRRAYGLQFHVELDRRLLDLWMEVAPQERGDLDEEAIRRIRTVFENRERDLAHQVSAIVRNFHRIVLEAARRA